MSEFSESQNPTESLEEFLTSIKSGALNGKVENLPKEVKLDLPEYLPGGHYISSMTPGDFELVAATLGFLKQKLPQQEGNL